MQAIIDAIEALIDTLADARVIYDYLPNQITQYPAVAVIPVSWVSSNLNLGNTQRDFNILIRVYGQIPDTGEDTAQKTVRDLTEDIVDLLQKKSNLTLSGTCDYINLEAGEFKFPDSPSKEYHGEIVLKVRKHFNRAI